MKRDHIVGTYLDWLRKENSQEKDFHNRYLYLAKNLKDHLFTLEELRQVFPNIFPYPSRPLVLEVGCYLGQTVCELASTNQNINVLGIDIKYKRVVRSCRRIIENALDNAKIAICTAQDLIAIIPESSLTGLCIFFPDPWKNKKKQTKKRLLNQLFIDEAIKKLSCQGFLWFKTDQIDYYNDVKNLVTHHADLTIGDALRIPIKIPHSSFFEILFSNQKSPIYELIIFKEESGG